MSARGVAVFAGSLGCAVFAGSDLGGIGSAGIA
jgi:hypothetical protein